MNRIALAWLLVLGMTAPAAAQAPVARMGELGVGGGISFPLDKDFRDSADTGFLFDLRGGYYVTAQHVLGAEFSWIAHSASDAITTAVSDFFGFPVEASFDFVKIDAYLKYLFTPKTVAPYVKVHAGLYQLRVSVKALGDSDTESMNDPGLGGGFGVQHKSNGPFGAFAEAIYHVDFTDDSATSFATLQAGVQLFIGGPREPR